MSPIARKMAVIASHQIAVGLARAISLLAKVIALLAIRSRVAGILYNFSLFISAVALWTYTLLVRGAAGTRAQITRVHLGTRVLPSMQTIISQLKHRANCGRKSLLRRNIWLRQMHARVSPRSSSSFLGVFAQRIVICLDYHVQQEMVHQKVLSSSREVEEGEEEGAVAPLFAML